VDWLTAEVVAQIAALLIAMGAFYKTSQADKRLARKEEVAAQEQLIAVQNIRIDTQNKRILELETGRERDALWRLAWMAYLGELQRLLTAAGISIPPAPQFDAQERLIPGAQVLRKE
jgi:hypothetical protein